MTAPMSDDRIAELQARARSDDVDGKAIRELLDEIKRLQKSETELIDLWNDTTLPFQGDR